MKRAFRADRKTGIQAKVLPRGTSRNQGGNSVWPRRALLVLCLFATAAATWAVFEFVIWNRLPPELVGKWVVDGGPQDGATFDFFRNGTLEARLNEPNRASEGFTRILKASVAVEDKTLLTTTRNPHTGKDETRRSIIRELTRTTLVVEFEQGEVWNMVRAE